jgi:xanthine dehydrogenase accessory factor
VESDGTPSGLPDLSAGPTFRQGVPTTITDHLLPLATRPKPATRHGVAYLPALPRVTILLVGGGHVGQAVARLASEVGFDIWVLDDRERYVSPERFPTATRRLVGDVGTTLRDLVPALTASTFAVILTRGHNHDEEALYHLAPTACGYVGMIGSKRKIRMIFEDLAAKGIAQEALERVHAPLGYNIGSQTVPEIAVSIVAELIACRNVGGTDAARWSWSKK